MGGIRDPASSAMELLRTHSFGIHFAPDSRSWMLFPWFGLILARSTPAVDLAFYLDHEKQHTYQESGYWVFYQQIDLLAKLLLEAACELGSAPDGLLNMALDLWEKLSLLEQHGSVLDEAIAMNSLIDADAGDVLYETWHRRANWFRSKLSLDIEPDPSRAQFHARVAECRSAIREWRSKEDPRGHGEALRGLERLRDRFGITSFKTRLELLFQANRVLVDERALVFPDLPWTQGAWSPRSFLISRNHRFRELVNDPARFLQKNRSAYAQQYGESGSGLLSHLLDPFYLPIATHDLFEILHLTRWVSEPLEAVLRERYKRYAVLAHSIPDESAVAEGAIAGFFGDPSHLFQMYAPPASGITSHDLRPRHAYHAVMTACRFWATVSGSFRRFPQAMRSDFVDYLGGVACSLEYPRSRFRLLTSYAAYLGCVRCSDLFDAPEFLELAAPFLETYIQLSDEVESPAPIGALRRDSLPQLERELDAIKSRARRS